MADHLAILRGRSAGLIGSRLAVAIAAALIVDRRFLVLVSRLSMCYVYSFFLDYCGYVLQ